MTGANPRKSRRPGTANVVATTPSEPPTAASTGPVSRPSAWQVRAEARAPGGDPAADDVGAQRCVERAAALPGQGRRHTDIGQSQHRRVVDPVPGHGHYVAAPTEAVHDPNLLQGRRPRDHRRALEARCKGLVIETLDVLARQHLFIPNGQTRLTGDRPRGGGMVAREHHHAHASGAAARYRGGRSRTQRIADPDEAQGSQTTWVLH